MASFACRRATLAALVLALCAASARAAATCPATGSSVAIRCWTGARFLGPPTGSYCLCSCGVSGNEDYVNAAGSTVTTRTLFAPATASTCTAAQCAANFPVKCAGAGIVVTPSLENYPTQNSTGILTTGSSGTPVVGSVCSKTTAVCAPNTPGGVNPCPGYLTSGILERYGWLKPGGTTVAAQCAAQLALPSVTVDLMCITDGCNCPSSANCPTSPTTGPSPTPNPGTTPGPTPNPGTTPGPSNTSTTKSGAAPVSTVFAAAAVVAAHLAVTVAW